MSGFRRNEITLYLRPIEYQPPYKLQDVAKWLVKKGKFSNATDARIWLEQLSMYDVFRFKALLSAYYEETDYKQGVYDTFKNVNDYRTSAFKMRYGEEPHMNYY